ncbi:hypothetical protein FH972_026092 [Carpinus fangiana]|uniref:Sulfite reductase [NADPH] subunit beta n=1 Tax=Carpinus fangiana TaxID=176857 RepID=A0A5N6L2X8_9ROSI|nr:hypothetical protein FH972_026092 [Carpinus fangiana]
MASISSASEAVARIAYQASDVVVSVQSSLSSASSPFAPHLHRLSAAKTPSIVSKKQTDVLPVRANADPLLSTYSPLRAGSLVSVTTISSILVQSIPHLYKLAQYPVVIHVALASSSETPSDYSDITAIRQCGFTFLHSETLREAQDLALTAHALAARSGRGVIHFFEEEKLSQDKPISADYEQLVERLLDTPASRSRRETTHAHDNTIYADSSRAAAAPSVADSSSREPSTSTTSRRDSDSKNSDNTSMTSVDSQPPKPVSSEDIFKATKEIWAAIGQVTGRTYTAFEYTGPSNAKAALLAFGADAGVLGEEMGAAAPHDPFVNTGLLTVRLYRPWLGLVLRDFLPKSITKIAVLEQVRRKTTKWGPLLMDVLTSIGGNAGAPQVVGYQLGHLERSTIKQALSGIFTNLMSETPIQNLEVGRSAIANALQEAPEQPQLENAYMKILDQVFENKLHIANRLGAKDAGVSAQTAASPEYGFGALLARQERRKKFIGEVQTAAREGDFTTENPKSWLSAWALKAEDSQKVNEAADQALARLTTDASPTAQKLLKSKSLFHKESQWLVGSDAWAYDLGNSGVHHVLASGKNINMLIIDSTPHSERAAADAERRKKDIGLYAMNFGNAYVASTAVYSSYTQVLEAMIEADKFDGPSVVLAYLPYHKESDSPLAVLQETKRAVDSGYWPLYRWQPAVGDAEPRFQLDSERIKKELEQFLARDSQLTQLIRRQPEFASNLSGSYGSEVRDLQKRKAKDAYGKLLESLYGAPMTVLFASDNGNAENLAKRLGNRGKARGLKTLVMAMDDYPIEDLPTEENVIFVTSTAGQGEFPQNGHAMWQGLKDSTDLDLANVRFSVFALGDSHYWPRKEDKVYYNKPGKDLHARLLALAGTPLAECGLGDDQDPDGYQTGYADWEPKLWQALGVDNVEGLPEEPPPITNEDIKIQSNFLRGTIAEGLLDTSTGAISASDQQLTKFHGTYMQDDRDLRDERKAQGLEPAYSFMIRCRLASGVATPKQWIQMDDISTNLGNETMKLTTRQTFQFHGIVKGKLRPAMQEINKALMTTLAACGDVNRNVMCSSLPQHSKYHSQVHKVSQKISDYLLPATHAYHEIWLKDEDNKKTQVAGDAIVDTEPMYGPTYLPRKFKITIAIPPHNDTDVYAHDVGLIAIQDPETKLLKGFNILAGGGMGVTHNNKKTYPRTGSMFGFCTPDQAHIVCEKIMLVQRDNGDRKNRKHARLKYTIDDMGVDVFKGKVEELWGQKFGEPAAFKFDSNIDTFGWQKDENGKSHFTMFIENGRIEDTADFPMKTGLREIAKVHKGEFRLTGNQHLILSDVTEADLSRMKELLKKYKLDNTNFSGLRLSSSACVAFPTCGLAMAESERYLPELVSKLEGTLEENGLRQDSIVMRMTGCPNGCARPWLAEVALVGKSFGAYNLMLGGGYHGQRINKLYRSSVKEDEILEILKPLIKRYALERNQGERFGDFVIRIGVIKPTTEGKYFHEDSQSKRPIPFCGAAPALDAGGCAAPSFVLVSYFGDTDCVSLRAGFNGPIARPGGAAFGA